MAAPAYTAYDRHAGIANMSTKLVDQVHMGMAATGVHVVKIVASALYIISTIYSYSYAVCTMLQGFFWGFSQKNTPKTP